MRFCKFFVCMAVFMAMLAASASAAVIGPWPAASGYLWENQPISGYTGGAVSVSGDQLLMPTPTSASKTSWLPYAYPFAEREAIAKLILDAGTTVASFHTKVYDPGTTGKSGWTVIIKDSAGKILDFGIHGYFAAGQIIPRQYDGVAWTNGPTSSRARTGNNYYTMDFQILADGRIQYYIDAYENGGTWNYGNVTTVAYADISEIYLSTSTSDTSGAANYKWTEFSYTAVPEPSSMVALASGLVGMAGFVIRRRK